MSSATPWGTHVEFVRRYEGHLLEAFLGPGGRAALATTIGSEITKRGATRLLDCAAGTGFPVLDLVGASTDLGLQEVHACDGDPVMIKELIRQAERRRIDLDAMNPRRRITRTPRQAQDDLVINWRDLRVVRATYDYVMCRGNSLAYADTWSGRTTTVSPPDEIRNHLARMAARIEAGGHLHVDAPWRLAPRDGPEVVVDTPRLRILEHINDHTGHREWLVHFTEIDERGTETAISFRRLSSPLTIHDIRRELQELDFDDVEPFQMRAERLVFGTIIARKRG